MTEPLDVILDKAANGLRLTRGEAVALASESTTTHVYRLGRAALANRIRRFGSNATYVLNVAINPSNICDGKCTFCHYHVEEGDAAAYVLSEDDIMARIATLAPREVHITGGMNRFWTFEKSLLLISRIRTTFPGIFIKAYTAVEIDRFARDSGLTHRKVLEDFKRKGLQSLTGGGAEIFSDVMRGRYCGTKTSPAEWLAIHRTAHELDIMTNATMLYGLGERPEEIVDHLIALRGLQDSTGGFSCFIPLAYQPKKGESADSGPSPAMNLRVIALARLIFDNCPHIKAYWPMIGLETAAAGLSWGADDLDGTLGEERIAHAGDARTPTSLSRDMMCKTIQLGGFNPVERDGAFT